ELRVIPSADAGDELTGRNRCCSSRDGFLQFRYRKRSFDTARFMTGVDTSARVMRMGINESRNDGAAAKINHGSVRRQRYSAPNGGNPTILNGEAGTDDPAPIDKFAIHQS